MDLWNILRGLSSETWKDSDLMSFRRFVQELLGLLKGASDGFDQNF